MVRPWHELLLFIGRDLGRTILYSSRFPKHPIFISRETKRSCSPKFAKPKFPVPIPVPIQLPFPLDLPVPSVSPFLLNHATSFHTFLPSQSNTNSSEFSPTYPATPPSRRHQAMIQPLLPLHTPIICPLLLHLQPRLTLRLALLDPQLLKVHVGAVVHGRNVTCRA